MTVSYSLTDLLFYLLLYAFLGWAVGVAYYALKDGKFINRGFLNLPFAISEGITAVALLLVLPTMEGHPVWQFLMTWLVVWIMDELTRQFMAGISRRSAMAQSKAESLSWPVTVMLRTAEALLYLMAYLLLHPFLQIFVAWLPDVVVTVVVLLLGLLVAADYCSVRYALHHGVATRTGEQVRPWTEKLGDRMTESIWHRLEKAYPGVEREEPRNPGGHTFAKGICFDKMVWLFLIASFLGALIEMVYCRITGGIWMNRSSLVYGPFSVVWGLGAVLLTVVLRRMEGKPDRYVFLAGFVVGGAYEYMCSVFTEMVYGTVFWDYSYQPLNFGGRTSVLFCTFWGILAVVWVKVLYPPIDRGIEKLPPVAGKVMTWIIVAAMACNMVLTSAAMVRYDTRQARPESTGWIEEMIDERFDDDWMENRWPNMKRT